MLWNMESVEGSEIFKAVQQTYYDRRIRELRESGWQIETIGTKYRLVSHEKLAGNEREYLSAEQKRQVLERDRGRFVVMLDKPLIQKIRVDAQQKGVSESVMIAEFLRKHYGL